MDFSDSGDNIGNDCFANTHPDSAFLCGNAWRSGNIYLPAGAWDGDWFSNYLALDRIGAYYRKSGT